MTDLTDPFTRLATKQDAPPKTAVPAPAKKEKPVATAKAPAKPADDAPEDKGLHVEDPLALDDEAALAAFMASLGDGLTFDDDEIFDAPKAFAPYRMPADKEWVPVRIADVEIVELNLDIVFNTERADITRSIPVVHLKLELDHASTAYGNRMRPYKLTVPAVPVTLGSKYGRAWKKDAGRRLFIAAKLATKSTRMALDSSGGNESLIASIQPYAEELRGKVIMAKIRHRAVPRHEVIYVKDGLGEYVYNDDGEIQKETKESVTIYDNLEDNTAAVPDRGIRIVEHPDDDDEENAVLAEITMNSIGRIVTKPVPPNTIVEALTEDKEIVHASWSGEQWVRYTLPEKTDAGSPVSQDAFKGDPA